MIFFETEILNSKVYCKAITSVASEDRLDIYTVHLGNESYIRKIKGVEKTFLRGSKHITQEQYQNIFDQVIKTFYECSINHDQSGNSPSNRRD